MRTEKMDWTDGAARDATVTVDLSGKRLGIRSQPAYDAPVVGQAADGEQLALVGAWEGWFSIRRGALGGYVRAEEVTRNYIPHAL